MEAQLLRDMIADRDKSIEKIQQKSKEQIEREAELRAALANVQAENQAQDKEIRGEKETLEKSNRTAIGNLRALQSDFSRQSDSLHSFCKTPTDAQMKDANFVMRLQAQLCKAMHSMAITEHEVELEKKHAEDIIKYQKEMVTSCIDEKTQTELKHMNELLAIDVKRRDAECVLKKKFDSILEERKVLEQQIAENEEDEEESETVEEDLDDEERAAKDEMMKILTERKAEIAKLESKLEEREETIAEMEEEMEDEDFDMEDLARARARVAAVLSEDGGMEEEEESEEESEEEESEDEEEIPEEAVVDASAEQVQNGDMPSSDNIAEAPLSDEPTEDDADVQTKEEETAEASSKNHEEDETLATDGSPVEDADTPVPEDSDEGTGVP